MKQNKLLIWSLIGAGVTVVFTTLNLLIMWGIWTPQVTAYTITPRTTTQTGATSNTTAKDSALSAADHDNSQFGLLAGGLSRNNTTQTITDGAGNGVDCNTYGINPVEGSGGDVTLTTANPRIKDPSDTPTTKFCIIEAAGTNRLTLPDGNGINLNGRSSIVIGTNAGDTRMALFQYNNTDWFLVSVSNSVNEGDIITTSVYWPAGSLSTDGTECSAPSEVTINSGPKTYTIACPMGTSETNGIIYGSTTMPDGWDGSTITLELVTYMTTDAGSGTMHTEAFAMCRTDDETINSTWGTSIDIDIVTVAGDAVNEILTATSAAITGDGCAAGETLFWKIEICDTDATPDGNCTSSAGLENDFSILGVKMEFGYDMGGD